MIFPSARMGKRMRRRGRAGAAADKGKGGLDDEHFGCLACCTPVGGRAWDSLTVANVSEAVAFGMCDI